MAHALPACPADPFTPLEPVDRDNSLSRPCGGEHLRWRVEPLDPTAIARRTGVLRGRFDQSASESIADGRLVGTVQMSWAGIGGEPASGLRTEHRLLSAGGRVHLGEEWSVQADAGRDLDADLHRATVGANWRPIGNGLVFAEWTADAAGSEAARVGVRWWLRPRQLAFDIDARREIAPTEQQRYMLRLSFTP